MRLTSLLREAQKHKDDAADFESKRVESNKAYDRTMAKALEIMEDSGCEGIKFDGIDGLSYSAFPRTTRNAKIVDHEEFESWCECKEIDPSAFKAYHSKKITSFYNEAFDRDDDLPAGVEPKEFTRLVIRKA